MNQASPQLPPSRAAALAVLEQTLPLSGKPGQDLQAALDNTLRGLKDPRDRALATELCYGFLRHKLRMERLVTAHLSKPDRTSPFIIRACALAAYELTFLDNVPAHATLSWAVDAVKSRLDQPRANLANAVLRSIQGLGRDAAYREFYDSTCLSELESLCVWYSCPDWLVSKWLGDYGRDAALRLLEAQIRPPLTGLRINTLKEGAGELAAALRSMPGYVTGRGPWLAFEAGRGPGHQDMAALESEGRLSRQSVAVGDILSRLEASNWPGPIWDACCGRGGKTTALMESGLGPVAASDPSLKRLRGLAAECGRLNLPAALVFRADAVSPPLRSGLGAVLLDAPCTGLGVLSRRPDAKWKRSLADITALAALQRSIIQASAHLPRAGGLLAYMTCTMTRDENEQQAAFIESLGFKLNALAEPRPEDGLREFFWGGVWEKR